MPVLEKNGTAAAGKSPLKKQPRLPVKRSINLASVNEKHINWPTAILAGVLILAAALAFGKFGVADRLESVAAARNEVTQVQRQLDAGYAKIAAYGELNEAYAHYTYAGMTEQELSLVDRVEVLDLIREKVMPRVRVDSWTLSGNLLRLNVTGSTLQEINQAAAALQEEELVDLCTVSNAELKEQYYSNAGPVNGSVIVYLSSAEGGDGQ